jgi:hypothetical protein
MSWDLIVDNWTIYQKLIIGHKVVEEEPIYRDWEKVSALEYMTSIWTYWSIRNIIRFCISEWYCHNKYSDERLYQVTVKDVCLIKEYRVLNGVDWWWPSSIRKFRKAVKHDFWKDAFEQ